jgi:hypothetical protein
MPVIKIHVAHEELAAIRRRAEAVGLSVEDLAYGAVSCTMTHCREASCAVRIAEAVRGRRGDLPLWSDSARSVSIYEGKPDVEQEPGPEAPS